MVWIGGEAADPVVGCCRRWKRSQVSGRGAERKRFKPRRGGWQQWPRDARTIRGTVLLDETFDMAEVFTNNTQPMLLVLELSPDLPASTRGGELASSYLRFLTRNSARRRLP